MGEAAGHTWKTSCHRLTSKQGNKKQPPGNYISKRLKKTAQKKTTKLYKHGSGDANTAASAVSSIVVRPEDSNLRSVFVQSRFFLSLQSKTNFNIIMTGNVKKKGAKRPLVVVMGSVATATGGSSSTGYAWILHAATWVLLPAHVKHFVAVFVSSSRCNSFLDNQQTTFPRE